MSLTFGRIDFPPPDSVALLWLLSYPWPVLPDIVYSSFRQLNQAAAGKNNTAEPA